MFAASKHWRYDVSQRVIPAKAGIHEPPENLDSRFRGSDGLIFMTLNAASGYGDSREEPALDSDRGMGNRLPSA